METQHCVCSKEGFGSNLHLKSQEKYCDLIVQYLHSAYMDSTVQ